MTRIMRPAYPAAALLVLAAACSPITTVTSVAPMDTKLPVTVQPNAATAAASQPAQVLVTAGPTLGVLYVEPVLHVLSPQDGTLVNTAQIAVTGTASPGAVVTVNDQILLIGADGTFQTTVALEEGPNLIEVIASNESGAQVTLDLTVMYQP